MAWPDGADLALALAIASSRLEIPVPADVAACGEVGLGGEVRPVARAELRIREAARLGFRRVLVPEGGELRGAAGAERIAVREVADAVAWLKSASRPVHGR